jgi:hypothetical protein
MSDFEVVTCAQPQATVIHKPRKDLGMDDASMTPLAGLFQSGRCTLQETIGVSRKVRGEKVRR